MKIILYLISTLSLIGCNNSPHDNNGDSFIIQPTGSGVSVNKSYEDTLAKYSYGLAVEKKDSPNTGGMATGFFIRNKKRIYLVSNYHVFTAQNTATKQSSGNKFDSISFFYQTINKIVRMYSINVEKIIQKSVPIYYYEHPDLYVYDLTGKLPSDAVIYSIENFIDPNFKGGDAEEIFSIGFAGINSGIPTLLKFNATQFPYDTVTVFFKDLNKQVTMTNSYLLNNPSVEGMSGSPVFYNFSVNGTHKIIFGGVISTHTKNGLTVVVKPSELMKLLK